MNLNQTTKQLVDETGCTIENEASVRLRAGIMEGNWTEADKALMELKDYLTCECHLKELQFLLRKQAYLDYLEGDQHINALECLRSQLTPLTSYTESVHNLTSFLMCSKSDLLDILKRSEVPKQRERQMILQILEDYFPLTVMIPPTKLSSMLHQADDQKDCFCDLRLLLLDDGPFKTCDLHSIHMRDDLPTATVQVLQHDDEVLFCKFSPNGTMLAVGCKDGAMELYDVNVETYDLLPRHKFDCKNSVVFIAWSPNNTHIVTCNETEEPLLIWQVETQELIKSVDPTPQASLTCAVWLSDSARFAAGGTAGNFFLFNIAGDVLKTFNIHVQCLARVSENDDILVIDTNKNIIKFDLQSEAKETSTVSHSVVSFSTNKNGDLASVNLYQEGIHLWDINRKRVVKTYRGLQETYNVIMTCFGGPNQNYIASGSGGTDVYIWYIKKSRPCLILKGHSAIVSCVDWHPEIPSMLASASDDHTVRIWGRKDDTSGEGVE